MVSIGIFFFFKEKYCGDLYPWHVPASLASVASGIWAGTKSFSSQFYHSGKTPQWKSSAAGVRTWAVPWLKALTLFFLTLKIVLTFRITRGELWSEGQRTDSLILYLKPSQEENHLPRSLINLSWAAWWSGSALLFSFLSFLWRWCEWFWVGTESLKVWFSKHSLFPKKYLK